ncbi:KAP family P-loop NTPase fold protein [Pseudomonas sp. Marseille-Q0931]|uniref:KAP family P-loop NTPase fold protein n=1 Tax=Pseudomonas sp. Marseille-Q0931 TaxID=2697507 RepID=UPI0023B9ECB8|nr:P-loop NTPase fold protein [Pseudomonas sp. Marseille-Q0931]
MKKHLPLIDSDQPLSKTDALDQDRLDRGGFAGAAVKALQRVSSTAGFVLSIEGPWGSGKTSVFSMMEQLLNQESGRPPVIAHFNPWLIGDRDALLRHFLGAIAAAINVQDSAAKAQKASAALLNYAKVFDFVKLVPGAEPLASIFKAAIESGGNAVAAIADEKMLDIEGQKDRLERALRKLDRKIYVFIDDVDRLFPTEVFEMVRIIKAVGHLPNVGYVVAWDPDYVCRALKAATVPHAASYLDKIVQVRLPLPAISAHARLQLLNSALDELPKVVTGNYFKNQEERLQSLYFSGLRELLEHPRDLNRVMNTLSVIEPGLRGEIVFADLLGLACLMVRAPRIYHALRKDPAMFTSQQASSYLGGDKSEREEAHRKKMDKLFAKSPNPNAVRKLVHHLFPASAEASGRSMYDCSIDVEGHLAAPTRLNIALSMNVGATDVSLVEARQYVVMPGKRAKLEGKLTRENCLGFLDLVGSIAKSISAEEVNDPHELCSAIARMVDKQPTAGSGEPRKFLAVTADALAISAINNLIPNSNLNPGKVAFSIASDPASLSIAANIISQRQYRMRDEPPLVCTPEDQMGATEAFARNAIDAATDGALWSKCDPSRILWTVMQAAPSTLAKKMFRALKQEDPSLDKFALHFLKHAYSSNGGQSYCLPKDEAIKNLVEPEVLVAHAKERLQDKSIKNPLRAAWRSVAEGKQLYGDGSESNF